MSYRHTNLHCGWRVLLTDIMSNVISGDNMHIWKATEELGWYGVAMSELSFSVPISTNTQVFTLTLTLILILIQLSVTKLEVADYWGKNTSCFILLGVGSKTQAGRGILDPAHVRLRETLTNTPLWDGRTYPFRYSQIYHTLFST